jgi:ornithine cyclodeaminase/alanine dehydrogenase-like protein (mu-crystallin family)
VSFSGNLTISDTSTRIAEDQRKAAAAEFLYLDQTAVLNANVLDMPRAFEVISVALRLFELGECAQPLKVVLRDGEDPRTEELGRFNGLCASIKGPNPAVGMKWIGSYPANRAAGLPRASAVIILNSPVNGLPIAIIDGTLISAMRTGAVTGLGARFLAPRSSRKAAVIGGGVQAHTQILGLFTALPELEEIAVFSRRRSHAEALQEDCCRRWAAPVVIADSVSAALVDADVIISITTASQPLIHASDVKPGALTIQMSGHEYDFDVILQCRKLVTDNWEALKHRGIITPALMHAQRLLQDDDVYGTLGELILGRKPGRENEYERIHFAHMGMGVEDIALAWDVYCTARDLGLGQRLKLWESPLWV